MGGRAYLVVDVASLRHAIGDVRGVRDGYGDLHLDGLVRVLRGRRYELTGIALAVGTEILVPHDHPNRARSPPF
jgi:hypothetical protein